LSIHRRSPGLAGLPGLLLLMVHLKMNNKCISLSPHLAAQFLLVAVATMLALTAEPALPTTFLCVSSPLLSTPLPNAHFSLPPRLPPSPVHPSATRPPSSLSSALTNHRAGGGASLARTRLGTNIAARCQVVPPYPQPAGRNQPFPALLVSSERRRVKNICCKRMFKCFKCFIGIS
jgi:hypothetical protein